MPPDSRNNTFTGTLKRLLRRAAKVLLGLLAVVLTVGYILPYGIHLYDTTKRSPEQNELLHFLRSQPVQPRPEWLAPQPAPRDLIRMMEEATEGWSTKHSDFMSQMGERIGRRSDWDAFDRVMAGLPLSDDDQATLTLLAETTSAALAERRPILDHPDYDLDLAHSGLMIPYFGDEPVDCWRNWFRFLRLSAAAAAVNGQMSTATLHTIDALRAARRHPGSRSETHRNAYIIMGYASRLVVCVAVRSSSTADLRTLAGVIDEAAPNLDMDTFDTTHAIALAALGTLRSYERAGYPVRPMAGRTVLDLLQEALSAAYHYPEWYLANAPSLDRRTPHCAWLVILEQDATRALAAAWTISPYALGFGPLMVEREALWMLGVGNYMTLAVCLLDQRVSQSLLRIARLTLASRIFELENDRPAVSMDELIPGHLPAALVDPFTGKPFLRTAQGMWYSVGPDGVDDRATALANPSLDGPDSRGDLFFGKAADELVTPSADDAATTGTPG